jgi:ABC-2 type transport system ATP-binding protein
MRQLIPRLAREGHTVLLASHLLVEVEQVCQRVAILKEGRVIAEGAVEALLRGEGALRVRVPASDLRRAQAELARHKSINDVRVVGEDLSVDTAADGAEVNRILAEAGIYASEIARSSRSLESVFLELTESEQTP